MQNNTFEDKQVLLDEGVSFSNTTFEKNVWIRIKSVVTNSIIKSNVFIGFKCKIQNTVINDRVQIASKCKIGDSKVQTIIEKFSWIGANATICSGVTIGEGSVIGANSIIKENIPPYSIAYGTKKLTIKKRKLLKDSPPDFKSSLLHHLKLKEHQQYIKSDAHKNYISATITNLGKYSLGSDNILIGNNQMNGGIFLENNVSIKNGNIFEGAGKIYLLEGSSIGNNVHIISNSHDHTLLSLPMVLQPVYIEKNVVIGDNSVILGGVTITEGTIIPSGSFIIKNT
ncbi:acyltransferase [Enterococcus plantarum]|uniref:acyltransferase n=1 Tax=Enterococcus plantarum TaxID=1077675 RepID=UPI001A903CC0|nr:DapH/DapD/GlmU-related protein [Enterococcus plantarum]MBO0422309.1 hypothetical protein [Enterococcus plantarum]